MIKWTFDILTRLSRKPNTAPSLTYQLLVRSDHIQIQRLCLFFKQSIQGYRGASHKNYCSVHYMHSDFLISKKSKKKLFQKACFFYTFFTLLPFMSYFKVNSFWSAPLYINCEKRSGSETFDLERGHSVRIKFSNELLSTLYMLFQK